VLPGKAEVVLTAVIELPVGTGLWVRTFVWLIDSEQVVVALLDG
jgi:hypothetical protein